MKRIWIGVVFVVAGCARSSVLPIASDMVQIKTSAAPICGSVGAQDVAVRKAAIETINRGFDRFIVLNAASQNTVHVAGYTPGTAYTTGSATAVSSGPMVTVNGSATTTYSPGFPIYAGHHDQGLVIKMFRDSDPQGQNAVDARTSLGPNWQETIRQGNTTTCG